jgi:flagellar capping protein FliD
MSAKTITQVVGGHSAALPPAPIYPAAQQLAKKLSEYDQAVAAVNESTGHLSRAEVDEQSAADSQASDSEDRLAVAQKSVGVYRARTASREKTRLRLGNELKAAANAGHSEYDNLLREVRSRRCEVMIARMKKAGQIDDRVAASDWEPILASSAPVSEISNLEISSVSLLIGNVEQIAGMSRLILRNFEALIKEGAKSI